MPFLFDPESGEPVEIVRFCEREVESSGKEADHPQVLALSRALKVNIDVAYVDGSSNPYAAASSNASGAVDVGKVDFVKFEAEEGTGVGHIELLYRPGHYDVLEKKVVV